MTCGRFQTRIMTVPCSTEEEETGFLVFNANRVI